MQSPLIDTKKLAELLDTSPVTVMRFRLHGGGPPFIRFGRNVKYRMSDVEQWLAECARQSTSEGA